MKTKKIVGISLFASVSYVLSYLSFPILPYLPFLKIDFSDLPVLIGTFYYGPLSGTLIAFIRSSLHYLLTGGELGVPIGDSAAFLASVSFVLPVYYYLNQHSRKKKNQLIAGAAGTISLTAVLTVLNWFVLVPAYAFVLHFDVGPMKEYLFLGIIPFNLIKGTILSVLFFSLFPKLQPLFKKQKKRNKQVC